MLAKEKVVSRQRRHRRVRKKIAGTAQRPRLTVYRSNRYVYAQVVDDLSGRTLVAARSAGEGKPVEEARKVGVELAERAKAAGITAVVFDRGGFKYHGRVKAVADGAREGGLEF